MNIPEELRLCILQHLTIDDLAEAAQVSKLFRADCKHPLLPQERTVTVRCVNDSIESLQLVLQRIHSQGIFRKLQRLKLHQLDRLSEITDLQAHQLLNKTDLIKSIKYLDISPSSAMPIKAGVLETIQNCMPEANDVNISFCQLPPMALLNCINLRTIRWASHTRSIPLLGVHLPLSEDLSETEMDNATFQAFDQTSIRRMCQEIGADTHGQPETWMLKRFGDKLERVSIKGCRYSLVLTTSEAQCGRLAIPQLALIKFVRNTPSLKWFRSDLTVESVAILQVERPDVIFV